MNRKLTQPQVAIPYCYVTIMHTRGHEVANCRCYPLIVPKRMLTSPLPDMLWKLMPWLAGFLAAWCAMWAVFIAQALPNADSRRRFRSLRTSRVINLHFIGGAVGCTVVMSILSALPSVKYDHTVVGTLYHGISYSTVAYTIRRSYCTRSKRSYYGRPTSLPP